MGYQSYVLLCTKTTVSNHTVVYLKSSCDVHLLNVLDLNKKSDFFFSKLRSGHCMVQINEDEVALIGGSELQSNLTYYDTIDIYNFEENTWREGPQ